MRILVLNCGSSSLKFRLLEVGRKPGDANRVLVNGAVKGIGGTGSLELSAEGQPKSKTSKPVSEHTQAIQWMFEGLGQLSGGEDHSIELLQVDAVGHRVVHGGEKFSAATIIDEAVEKEIDELIELAPLHNPACLAGIRGARAILDKKVPMVAVFDTAFHRAMPAIAKMYALPYEFASRHRIHRYGFHGIAHASLADGYAAFTGRSLSDTRIITLQLGNGCSVAAIAGGKSVETSMGFTPLEGLVMGTRSGDLDPSVVTFLAHKEKVDASEVERWLNEESGLLGLSGRTNDMRELLHAATEGQDERAKLAIELFCYRAKKYIGAYLAVLGGADAIVFGGGIGEASPDIRAMICEGMEWCGSRLSSARNRAAIGLQPGQVTHISEDGSPLKVYVVAADEETWIARETVKCLQATRKA
jgi:acetate kinase